MRCKNCKSELTTDEIGLHKKLINRWAEEFMCISCMAKYFNIPKALLLDKIKLYKEIGCTLFD